MSSAHVLLSSLQDRAKLSAESCRAMLAELLSFCRYDELKSDIMTQGLDTLLALSRDEALTAAPDVVEALLELLNSLMLDSHAVRARFVQQGVLHVALDAFDALLDQKPTKKRNKTIKLALEMADQWSCVAADDSQTRVPELQKAVLVRVLRVLSNTTEDANLLLHAAEVLGCMLERNAGSIQTVAKLDGISTLLRLLEMPGELMDVKRSVCEALLIMGDAPGMIQVMASDNVIHALCACLRAQIPGRNVECVAIRLLSRLAEEAQVYGQIINEDMLPLLFQVTDRNCDVLEVAAPACAILERLSRFARDCKLDLSSYVHEASCRGKVLISAAACNVHGASLVLSVFRFFVHISYNPVDLPLLINSESVEGLLALYILNGSSGSLSTLSSDLVQILSSLSRSAIEALTLKDDDTSLPSLFLCLRNHYDNLRFASQVYALLTKYWRAQAKSAHSITGFVGIAVDILCRYARTSLALCDELMEIYNFLREVLLSRDGVEVVLSCGGKALCEALRALIGSNQQPAASSPSGRLEKSSSRRSLHQNSHPSLQLSGEISKVASILLLLLERTAVATRPEECVAGISPVLVSRRIREGDGEYGAYVSKILRKERSCLFKTFDSGALKLSASGAALATRTSLPTSASDASRDGERADDQSSGGSESEDDNPSGSDFDGAQGRGADDQLQDEPDAAIGDDDEAELDNDGNDDGSDGDGSEEGDAAIDIGLELCDLTEDNQASGGTDGTEDADNAGQLGSVGRQVKLSPPKTFTVKGWSTSVDFSQYADTAYYFLSPLGIKYPKHPSRRKLGSVTGDDNNDDRFELDQGIADEPCKAPSPDVMSAFIEQASLRRQQFLQSDPSTRAELVYDSKSHFENLGSAAGSETPLSSKSPVGVDPFPYFVPKKSGSASNINSLTFDSCFESGNLERAVQIGEWEYDLFLRRDFNTNGHMQWFYFAVSNVRARENGGPSKYRFNIVNLCKPDSLFNQGLQPVVYSVRDAHLRRTGWLRSGTEIYYFSNPFPRSSSKCTLKAASSSSDQRAAENGAQAQTTAASPGETYFTLTFTLEFANADDTYLVAHSYPYTLTDHHDHLERISNRMGRRLQHILRRSVLCKTLSGKSCDLLSISDFSASTQEQKARRAVVISSRVHPGEAQASWMMRGIIDFLVGESDIARVLRRLFVFQIIPILNPDGVYYGNSRCSLAACDLNRHWHNPSQTYHPTIFHTKNLLKRECASRGVVFFCDLHGHSRKKNVFMYGCDTKKRPNPRARAFAKLFSTQQTAKKYISFADCSFKISKSKETTARVVVANELKLSWCFTLEASFCGGNFGELQGMHYNTRHMTQVGSSLCETLFQACISDASMRERLVAMVDDCSVNVAGYADSQLRESGIICDGSSSSALGRDAGGATPRKARAAGARRASDTTSHLSSKAVRRKSSSSKSSKLLAGEAKSQQQSEARKPDRKQSQSRSRQRPSLTQQAVGSGETREVAVDAASPRPYLLSSDPQVHDHLGLPRAKMSGKKLRNKKKKAKKKSCAGDETTTDKCQADTMPAIPACASQHQHHAPEADKKPVHTVVRGTSSSSSSTSSGSSTPLVPTKPSAGSTSVTCVLTNPSLRSSHGCLQLADSIMTIIAKPAAGVSALPEAYGGPDFQAREPTSVVLPPPVGDLVVRSPKLKSPSVRFRGAGRQFAAVSPVRQKSLKDIMRSESIRYTTYDQDLLSASAMAIRQRSSFSASNNAFQQSRPVKLTPATSASPYLSFPSVN